MRNSSRFLIPAFLALLLCAGCIRGPADHSHDPLLDKFTEITMAGHRTAEETIVLSGFSLRWDKEPQRVNKVGAAVLGFRPPTKKNLQGNVLLAALKGGPQRKSQTYHYLLKYASIKDPDAVFYHGEVDDIKIEKGRGRRKVNVNLNSLGFSELLPDEIGIYLRGFYLNNSVSHAAGFPLKKISVRIDDVDISRRGTLTFTAYLEMDAGPRAMRSHYEDEVAAEGKLFYTIAGSDYGAATAKKVRFDATARDMEKGKGSKVEIQGAPEQFSLAYVGTRSITLDWSPSAFLVREIRFLNKDFHYDPETGLMRFTCDAGLDNTGLSRYINKTKVTADMVLMQFDDVDASVAHKKFKGATSAVLAEKKFMTMTGFHFSIPGPEPDPAPGTEAGAPPPAADKGTPAAPTK